MRGEGRVEGERRRRRKRVVLVKSCVDDQQLAKRGPSRKGTTDVVSKLIFSPFWSSPYANTRVKRGPLTLQEDLEDPAL